jgi:hypothetical protein
VTTPEPQPRRSGWLVLLAVSAVVVGGAYAVRQKKRKQTARPAPSTAVPERPAVPQPAVGESDRTLRRMAIGGLAVVVLAVALVIALRPGATDPAGPGGRVTVAAGSSRAEVTIERVDDPYLDWQEFPGRRNVRFTVRVANVGAGWVGARVDQGAEAIDADGNRYEPNGMLSLVGGPSGPTDPVLNADWQVAAGTAMLGRVAFTVPHSARLVRLTVTVPMGDGRPSAALTL